ATSGGAEVPRRRRPVRSDGGAGIGASGLTSRLRRVAARGASRDEEGSTVRDGVDAERRHGEGGLLAADRCVVDAGGVYSGYSYGGFRRSRRIDYPVAHRTRSQCVCAWGA